MNSKDQKKSGITATLRFRMSLLFIISLTVLSVVVLTLLMRSIEQRLLTEIDDFLYERVDYISEYVDEEFYDFDDEDDDDFDDELSREDPQKFEKEIAEVSEDNKDEVFILSHEHEGHLFTKSSNKEYVALQDSWFEYFEDFVLETYTIEQKGFPCDFRFLSMEPFSDYVLTVGLPMNKYYAQVNKIRWYFVLAAICFILLGGGLAWMTVAGSMKGVEQVSAAAYDFGSGNLQRRVNWKGKGSEIEQLAASFNAMAARTEVLIQEMKDVTNNIAHDLRTPVTRMRGIAENALQKEENPELAAKIIEESERQTAIIEDILNLSESESGVLEMHIREENLNEILKDMIELYEPLAEESGTKLKLNLPDAPVMANLDKSRFQRAAANILDNALKYSGGGEVLIELYKTDRLNIRVMDQGPGIPQELKSNVFKRFVRGDKSRSSGGSGLGLSLAKSYIHNHGGDIILEETEKGASFVITLPA